MARGRKGKFNQWPHLKKEFTQEWVKVCKTGKSSNRDFRCYSTIICHFLQDRSTVHVRNVFHQGVQDWIVLIALSKLFGTVINVPNEVLSNNLAQKVMAENFSPLQGKE